MLILVLMGSVSLFAGAKVVKTVKKGNKNPQLVKQESLPKDRDEIIIGEDQYYADHGVFYKKHPEGYKISKAPKGAHVKHVPDGMRRVRRHDRDYFVFYHTWYIYDDVERVYIVVDSQDDNVNDYESDTIYLVNGSVMVGTFVGGNSDYVKFLFNGSTQRIPKDEIIYLEFGAELE
jgi:hypothetical protein